jgi:hypothetical protein
MTECRNPEKVRYKTEGGAWAAIREQRAREKFNSDVRPYPCGEHWHIGHSVVALSKRIRKALKRDR